MRPLGWWSSCALLCVGASVWFVQHARAELGERAFELGRDLRGVVGLLDAASSDTALEINGQLLHLTSFTSDSDAGAVLNRFESVCAQNAQQLAEALRGTSVASASQPHEPVLGVLRQDMNDGTGGVAACLARTRRTGLAELLSSFVRYAQTGDLAEFGLRYVFVRRSAGGGSHTLLAWNEGQLSLRAMFPERGDAAGSDLAGLPRPSHGRRLLSVQVRDRAYGMAAYSVAGEPRASLESYTRQLGRLGFRSVHVAPELGADRAIIALVRGRQRAIVQSFRQADKTVLALLCMDDHAPHQESVHVE